MKKSDLVDGMVVELNELSNRYLILGNKMVCNEGFNRLIRFDDNLTHVDYNDLNVVKVYKLKLDKSFNLNQIFDDSNLELIWEDKIGVSRLTQ